MSFALSHAGARVRLSIHGAPLVFGTTMRAGGWSHKEVADDAITTVQSSGTAATGAASNTNAPMLLCPPAQHWPPSRHETDQSAGENGSGPFLRATLEQQHAIAHKVVYNMALLPHRVNLFPD